MKNRRLFWGALVFAAAILGLGAVAAVVHSRTASLKTEEITIEGEGYRLWVPAYSEEVEIVYSEYNEETDWDWTYASGFGDANIVKGKDVFYARLQDYIYICDIENEELIPLCNRPDCLHNEETDASKRAECGAYVPAGRISGCLQYYNGKLYANAYDKVDGSGEVGFYGDYIYELALDGSGRKLTPVACENSQSILVHRGRVYYCSKWEDYEAGLTIYEAREVPLKGGDYRVIARLEREVSEGSMDICPCGDCVYVNVTVGDRFLVYDMERQATGVRETGKEIHSLYPAGREIYAFSHERVDAESEEITLPIQGATQLYVLDVDGNNLTELGMLPNGDMELLGLETMVGGKSPDLSLDRDYIYQILNREWVYLYDRTSLEVAQAIPLPGFTFCDRVGAGEDHLIISDSVFGDYVLWLEKDKMLEEGAQFHVLRP